MRKSYSNQLRLDSLPIEQVTLNLESRDRIVPILRALQYLYADRNLVDQVLALIAADINGGSRTETPLSGHALVRDRFLLGTGIDGRVARAVALVINIVDVLGLAGVTVLVELTIPQFGVAVAAAAETVRVAVGIDYVHLSAVGASAALGFLDGVIEEVAGGEGVVTAVAA